MSGLDIFTWIVVLIMMATVGIVFGVLGMMPGKVASQRRHPQVEAIRIASWLALIFGFALWPVVLVWAYLKPLAPAAEARITELETRIAELEAAAEGGPAR